MTDAVLGDSALVEELRWAGAGATAARVRAGELTPQQTALAALARIEAAQPALNAFVSIRREEALVEAQRVAERLAAGVYLPLAGVPVAIKDEVPLEGVIVTHGSRAYTQPSGQDADVVRLLRAAGAIVVGTTRTPEFCLMPFTESELGGVTRNPWDPSRTPGGSSGGSAAAVAAGLVPIAHGADGGGSIRAPAAWCGLPGLFPTPGAVSHEPMGLIWTGLVSHGGLARSIADTALLMDVLLKEPQQLAHAITDPPTGLRIAQTLDRAIDQPLPQGGKVEAPWIRAADLTATALSEVGHTVEPVEVKFGNVANKYTVRYLTSAANEIEATDAPSQIEPGSRLLLRVGRQVRRFLPWALNSAPEIARVEAALEGFDLLLTPTMPCAPPRVGERDGVRSIVTTLRASRRVSFLSTWNHLGWPGITVPAGLDAQGLPVAALLTGRPGSERLLLQVAAQLEQTRPWPLGKAV